MTKSSFVTKVTKKTMKAKKDYSRRGYSTCAEVHYMHLRINHMVSIDMPTLLKAHLFSDDRNKEVGIMTPNKDVIIWVDDDSIINVL